LEQQPQQLDRREAKTAARFAKEWMRKNPKVCIQVDEIESTTCWVSAIGSGRYEELPELQYLDERAHARQLLERRPQWWLGAMAERQLKSGNKLIQPLFFRVHIDTITGLRTIECINSVEIDEEWIVRTHS